MNGAMLAVHALGPISECFAQSCGIGDAKGEVDVRPAVNRASRRGPGDRDAAYALISLRFRNEVLSQPFPFFRREHVRRF